MRRIRQHGPDRLFDLKDFIPDILRFHQVSHWSVDVEWCLVRDGNAPDEASISEQHLSTIELEWLYRNVFQTIDGRITAYSGDTEVAQLEAVDSSYWEIESQSEEFLNLMEQKYGVYQINATSITR